VFFFQRCDNALVTVDLVRAIHIDIAESDVIKDAICGDVYSFAGIAGGITIAAIFRSS
jgi:hypothetical protein